jgi:hypothetical protein
VPNTLQDHLKSRLDSPAQSLFGSAVFRTFAIGFVCTSLALAGCCVTGPWASQVCADHVVIFSRPPAQNYFVVGNVSSPGGRDTVPADNYHRMQREAACLGAAAVILTDQIPNEEPDFWQYPHTGVAIVYATSSLWNP